MSSELHKLVADRGLEPSDAVRFGATIGLLPPPPLTVLDAGCGTGVLADVLLDAGYDVLGVDVDAAAMTNMRAPHRLGSIDALPVRAVDVVVANEVLEHLPAGTYENAIEELARVAQRHIVVSVPNAEALEAASTRCPACSCVYSVNGHVRRFNRQDMPTLVPGFRLTSLSTVGPFKVRHRGIEWVVKRRLLGYWPLQPGAKCPQCAYQQPGIRHVQTRQGIMRTLAGIPWHRWWLVARYDR